MSQPGTFKPRDPVRDRETLKEIDAAIRISNLPLAIDLARAALNDGLVHAQLYNLRSYWLEQQGRPAEALADVERMLPIAEDKVAALTAYGFMLEKLNRLLDSAAALEKAAELAPSSGSAMFNLGMAYHRIGALEKAEASFTRTIALVPNHIEAMVNLADIHYRRGDMNAATETAEKILALEPGLPQALIVIARVEMERGEFDRAEKRLIGIQDNDQLPPIDWVTVRGLLGEIRNTEGRYAEAFDFYTQANKRKDTILSARRHAPEDTTSHLKWLTAYFESAPASKWAAQRDIPIDDPRAPAQHVFLVGFLRSGTTLLENILASHPDVVTLEEKELLTDSFLAFLTNEEGRSRLENMPSRELDYYRDLYWQRAGVHGIDARGKIFVDKHPLISTRLMLVSKLFPNAKILFAIRDPRDIALSCYRRSFNKNFTMAPFLTLRGTAELYDLVMKLGRMERKMLGLQWHDLKHESLVNNFDSEMQNVCDFIGLDWSDDLKDFAKKAQAKYISTPSALQVKRGLNRESIGIWRNYKSQLEPIQPILAPWVKEFGYSAE